MVHSLHLILTYKIINEVNYSKKLAAQNSQLIDFLFKIESIFNNSTIHMPNSNSSESKKWEFVDKLLSYTSNDFPNSENDDNIFPLIYILNFSTLTQVLLLILISIDKVLFYQILQ